MSISVGKRPRPTKTATAKAHKRQKLDQEDVASKVPGKSARNGKKPGWKRITLPDFARDFEGLSGFVEELEDAEIVTDEATGRKKLLVNGHEQSLDAEGADEDASSFTGFDDADEISNAPAPREKSENTQSSKPKLGSKKGQKASDRSVPPQGAFTSLDNATMQDHNFDISAWKKLDLSPDTLASLTRLKFSKPTPIQEAVIPEILAGHDVIGKASTGSGKTLAFGIPIFERYQELRLESKPSKGSTPLALILSPTRELAKQLTNHIKNLCASSIAGDISIALLEGGMSKQKQQRELQDAKIVIGTPGRLWDIISQSPGVGASLKNIEFLVIDEADRLLSEGHFKEVEDILNSLDRVDHHEENDEEESEATASDVQRQTLVFSATFDRGLQKKLAGKGNQSNNMLSNKESLTRLLSKLNFREEIPKFIDVNPVQQMASGLKEGLVECSGTEKDLYLYALLLLHKGTRTLIFVNSINAVRRITPMLRNLDVAASALHSEMPQKARYRSIEQFREDGGAGRKSAPVLIATDVAARGLDIPSVQLVVHYHLPRAADMYVHRSGRTARAGQKGSSVLICAPSEVAGVRRLVATVHARSASSRDPGASDAVKQGYYIRTLDIDRRVVARLKERATLAKNLADATVANEKHRKEDDFMRAAAEELGAEYDSEEFAKQATGKRGRGSGRQKKERAARELSKADLAAMRGQLKEMLSQRVNVGVSERYLTSGKVDIDELLQQQDAGGAKTGEFLGAAGVLGLEDL